MLDTEKQYLARKLWNQLMATARPEEGYRKILTAFETLYLAGKAAGESAAESEIEHLRRYNEVAAADAAKEKVLEMCFGKTPHHLGCKCNFCLP
jgi:hypothetical protein